MSSDDGKVDRNDDREDIRWFENHEKHGKHLESLKNRDILNYIKDIERNCRLEVSSGDEDYAGTKRSSNCSVRSSGARFRLSKAVKSRVTSRRNKNAASSGRKVKRSSDRNHRMDGYSRSSRNSRFRGNLDLAIPGNSKENLNAPAEPTYPRSSSKRGSYNCRESSPRFYGWYSRKDRRTWPATTETTSLEIITDRRQNITLDRGIDSSRITEKKPARLRAFKSLHRKKMDEPTYMSTYSNVASNEKAEIKVLPRFGENQKKIITRMSRFNDRDNVSSFVNHQRLNKFYLDRGAYPPADSLHQESSRNKEYEGRYTSRYPYLVRKSVQPASWSQNARSNRLTTFRLPEMSLRRRALRRENEAEPPLGATGSITGAGSIDKSYRRQSWHKNNTDQRRREPDVPGERGSPCCRRPGFLRESGKLCKVLGTREGKQLLGCCCEDVERDEETAECSVYCRCPENVNRRHFQSTARRTLREAPSRSLQSWNNHEEALDFDLSTGERRNETAMYDNASMFNEADVIFNDDRANDRDHEAPLGDLEPHAPLPDDWTYRTRRPSEIARKYGESSCNLNNRLETGTGMRRTLRRRITRKYSTGEEFSFVIRTPRKLAPRDSRRLPDNAAESVCDCRELFHDPPAACLAGSCTCIDSKENIQQNRTDNDDNDFSSREISTGEVCCSCCCCCSSSSDSKNDPMGKLESFCGKVDQDTLHEPSRSIYNDAQRHPQWNTNERSQSIGTSNEAASQTTRSTRRGWLTDGAKLGKPRCIRRDRTNLDKILIYPPQGETGPPLTLYKGSSNINCRVKGDADAGFRYSVTYVQKFVSPTWMPGASPEVATDEECEKCSADHG